MKCFKAYDELRTEIYSILEVIRFILNQNDPSIKEKLNITLCNGNIIILGTLLESFLENIILEYTDEITILFNNRLITFAKLPKNTQLYISKKLLTKHHKQEFETMYAGEAYKFVSKLLLSFQVEGFLIDDELDGINRFSFGKHGESEIRKMFSRLDIDVSNIFDNFDEVNNFFQLRNNLIHSENVGLTKLPPQDIEVVKTYALKLYLFAKKINEYLSKEIHYIGSSDKA